MQHTRVELIYVKLDNPDVIGFPEILGKLSENMTTRF